MSTQVEMQFQYMFFYFYFQETHQLTKHVTKTVNAVFSFVIFCLFPLTLLIV